MLQRQALEPGSLAGKDSDIIVGLDGDLASSRRLCKCLRLLFLKLLRSLWLCLFFLRRRRCFRLLLLALRIDLRRRSRIIMRYQELVSYEYRKRNGDCDERAFFHVCDLWERIVAAGMPRMAVQ